MGLTNSADLAREEERISKKKAMELFENGMLNSLSAGRFATLQKIHKYLFDDIFDFAGEIRTVNLAKGNFRFAPMMYLQAALENVEKMPQSNFDEIIEKYVEMNVAHPFREGNGRSTRIWLDHILKTGIGKVVDWSKVDKEDYLLAMERSPIKDVEIKVLLKAALTDEVDSREIYMKGIDHSYYYEAVSYTHLLGRVHDVDQALVGAALKLLAAVLILVNSAQDVYKRQPMTSTRRRSCSTT